MLLPLIFHKALVFVGRPLPGLGMTMCRSKVIIVRYYDGEI